MITVPDFLPDNQKDYLKVLIKNSTQDTKALAAVELLIEFIEIVERFSEGKGRKILKGAHIVIDSPGIYQEILSKTHTINRTSSHYKNQKVEEKGVMLKAPADFLIGRNKDNKVWFQTEAHKVSFVDGMLSGTGLLFLHMIDFLKYKWHGKNIGPCGQTRYTEKNPIIISLSDKDYGFTPNTFDIDESIESNDPSQEYLLDFG